jgi:hypothetical protein
MNLRCKKFLPPTRAALGWLALIFLFAVAGVVRAADEQQVKAAFIPHLAGFVTWPSEVFTNDLAPVKIGIVGDFNLGADFETALTQKTMQGRKFSIQHCDFAEEMLRQNILLIAPDEKPARVAEILAVTAGKPILTIGDRVGFASAGGVINFIKENGKVRFEVNVAAAAQNRLKINSRLLQVAKVIPPGAEKGGKP